MTDADIPTPNMPAPDMPAPDMPAPDMPVPFTGDAYTTPVDAAGPIARLIPTLAYYPMMAGIVRRAAAAALRKEYPASAWVGSSLEIVRALERTGVRLHIEGMDHFTRLEGPCVFVGNHMSTLETFVLPSIIQPHKNVTFVVKQSLADYPVFKHVLHARDPITVGRVNPRDDLAAVLEGGEERLNRGISIIIFPQATRSDALDPKTFNSIGVKLARRAGVPVVPLALKTDAWGTGWPIKDFGPIRPQRTVHFRFAAPLAVAGNGKDEQAAVYAFIAGCLAEWRNEIRAISS